jgi:hypothetical protein
MQAGRELTDREKEISEHRVREESEREITGLPGDSGQEMVTWRAVFTLDTGTLMLLMDRQTRTGRRTNNKHKAADMRKNLQNHAAGHVVVVLCVSLPGA